MKILLIVTIGIAAFIAIVYIPFANAMIKYGQRENIKEAKKRLEKARKSYDSAHKFIDEMYLFLKGTEGTLEDIDTTEEEIRGLIRSSNIVRAKDLLRKLKDRKGGRHCAFMIRKLLEDVGATLNDIDITSEEIDRLHKENYIREGLRLIKGTVHDLDNRGFSEEEIAEIFEVFDPKKIKQQ